MKRLLLDFMILALSCSCSAGCSMLSKFFRDEKKIEPVSVDSGASRESVRLNSPQSERQAATSTIKVDEIAEMQLKLTRMSARMAEIEEKISNHQERFRIIERGLTLGIVPEELHGGVHGSLKKNHSPKAHTHVEKPADSSLVDADDTVTTEDKASDEKEKAKVEIDPEKREAFNKSFAAAHDDFRAGRFGKAIVGFSELGKQFDSELTNGVHQFWIARSWSALREFQTARRLFSEFIQSYPGSPWQPRAKLELARVESALGLRETALKRLRQIISDHPMEDVSEMAKADIGRISKSL